MSTSVTSTAGLGALLGSAGGTSTAGAATLPSAADQSANFLTLLTTQMQNQDPLNPMDNSQLTSQLAQISTVSGIDNLNQAIQQLASVQLQSQALQGAALIGRSVMIAGNDLQPDANGKAGGGFELAGAADSVTVSVTDSAGNVVDTIALGAQSAGRHSFDWQAPGQGSYTFAVSAKSGSSAVAATTYAVDQVSAVYTSGTALNLETNHHGDVALGDIAAIY